MEFQTHSNDALSEISLHDCVCDKLCYAGNQLILELAWMEILPSHPANPFEKAHQTDSGKIVLASPVLVEGNLIPFESQTGEQKLETLEGLSHFHLTLLDFSEEKKDGGYQANLFAELDCSEPYSFIELTIRYPHSEVMWNHFTSESWFEDEKWKKRS